MILTDTTNTRNGKDIKRVCYHRKCTRHYKLHDYLHETIVPNTVATILKVKKIKPKIHPDFGPTLGTCIETIWSYRRLCADIENIRKTPFDGSNPDHEDKLLKLWRLLMPDVELNARITKAWQDIGFQGDNPMTDFRGMCVFSTV